jgi:hypothetical protein
LSCFQGGSRVLALSSTHKLMVGNPNLRKQHSDPKMCAPFLSFSPAHACGQSLPRLSSHSFKPIPFFYSIFAPPSHERIPTQCFNLHRLAPCERRVHELYPRPNQV